MNRLQVPPAGIPARLLATIALAGALPACGGVRAAPGEAGTPGSIVDAEGRPVAAAFVGVETDAGMVTVLSDSAGRFRLPDLPDGTWTVRIHRPGFSAVEREVTVPGEVAPVTLPREADFGDDLAASAWLALLPDGPEKRRFVLDCTGCHTFRRQVAAPGGVARSADDWRFWIERMLSFAGASTGFPVMSPERDAERTAQWLARHLGAGAELPGAGEPPELPGAGRDYRLTEYDLPLASDLPHDLVLLDDGRVLVTGMMSHRLWLLDPATGRFAQEEIPVEGANPRAVNVDAEGRWWVLLGFPRRVATRAPGGAWSSFDIGVYGHDVVPTGDGRAFVNGHFTKDPEVIVELDTGTGATRTHEVPTPASVHGGTSIPYGLARGPDGVLWMTQLAGGRLVRLEPSTGTFRLYDLPTPHAGPRRLDVGADGTVWVPEYAANALARFDAATETFREYPFPRGDALPYIARVDPESGAVWVATAASNTIARFDPVEECFVEYPLPHPAALVRHIAVDPATGAVWGTYSPSPAIRPAVFKLEAAPGGC